MLEKYPKSRMTPITFCHSLYYRLVTFTIVHVAILVILTDGSKSVPCDVTCMRGSRCFREKCLPCPEGYFQDESGHQHTKCKPWTSKPNNLNFVIKTPGTRTHDVEWTCKEGHELFRYTPGEYECRKIVTTSPRTSVTTAPSTSKERIESTTQRSSANVTSKSLELGLPGKNNEKRLRDTVIVSVCVFVPISLLALGVLLCYKYRRAKSIKLPNKRISDKVPNLTVSSYDSENPSPLLNETSREDVENIIHSDESLTSDINFSYFSAIISQLGKKADSFIQHL